MTKGIDPITLEILWNRLIGITDEAAITLVRSCFSTIIRDSHDFSIAIFDDQKRFLAQSSTSTPGQLGCMPSTIENFCNVFPPETLQPGDAIITNNPWLASAHLNDVSIASPIFYHQKLVGFSLCTVHHVDIGGRYATIESEEIFEEGLLIPICKIYKEDIPNEDLLSIIRHNVRVPEQVIGDMQAQMAAIHLVSTHVNELLEEYNIDNLREVGDEIICRSEEAMRKRIREIPNGTYTNTTYLDRFIDELPILSVTIHVIEDQIIIDYEGTSRQIHRAINSPLNMVYSESVLAIKSLLDPFIPNNIGCMRPITVKAPEGSIANAKWPAPVWARTMVIHRIPELIYGALYTVLPNQVIAESGSAPLGSVGIISVRQNGERCLSLSFFFGGLGARSTKDGIGCLSFPHNIANKPIELIECDVPILWGKKELICDSGGAGMLRGGLGEEFAFSVPSGEIGPAEGEPVFVSIRGGRFERPPQGILGGKQAKVAEILVNNKPVRLEKRFILKPGDRLLYRVPGGGGYGNPFDRDPRLVEDDVKNSIVSIEGAKENYGVVIDRKTLRIEEDATKRLRTSLDGQVCRKGG